MPRDPASRVATATCSALKSSPTTRPGAMHWAMSRVIVPGPQPQSRTVVPELRYGRKNVPLGSSRRRTMNAAAASL